MQNLIDYERGDITLWEFIVTEKALFIVFGVILAINVIVLLTVWPYVCVRGCCKSKFKVSALFEYTFYEVQDVLTIKKCDCYYSLQKRPLTYWLQESWQNETRHLVPDPSLRVHLDLNLVFVLRMRYVLQRPKNYLLKCNLRRYCQSRQRNWHSMGWCVKTRQEYLQFLEWSDNLLEELWCTTRYS